MTPLGIAFLVLMLLWLFMGLWLERTPGTPYPVERGAGHLLHWILFAILGYVAFGGGR